MQVAMRALGFDCKKPEVIKLIRDHDKDGQGLMDYEDFTRISALITPTDYRSWLTSSDRTYTCSGSIGGD